MRYLLLICLFLAGCDAGPNYTPMPSANSCLVDAIAYKDAYDAKYRLVNHDARVLHMTIVGHQVGHAICVYTFHDNIFGYDKNGSKFLTRDMTLIDQPIKLAELYYGVPSKIYDAFYY
jgi:hypothetical protein